jgi:nitrogen fixation protein NifU and related proteins
MQLDAMYQEIILDHYRNPHHKGLRDPHNAEAHHINPTCGDEVTLRVALTPAQGDGALDDQAVVSDVSYEGMGCSISQASTSVLTDLLIGRTVAEGMRTLEAFNELMHSKGKGEPDEEVLEDAVAFSGVSKYPARIKCALLGWMAWKDATVQSMQSEPRGSGEGLEGAS